MEGLPFLPGNTFRDPTKTNFHVSHNLTYKNGYALPKRPEVAVGGIPIQYNQLSESELDELANFKPTLTYGQAKQAPPEDFVPGHVAWDKKVLKFDAWFKQTVCESPEEHFRVRHVGLYYYLEDDSIAVIEPHVENSGIPQGKLIKRQRLPKNDVGDHWHWKDLNVGVNVTFYGKVFHIYNCDKWTSNYLTSEGIDVNSPEGVPSDPYIERRVKAAELRTYKTPTDFDKLRQFLEMDRKVLRFYCVWDDRDKMFGQMRKFILHYYLVDDTLEIREVHNANDGRDPFPVLICRHKVPKDRYHVPSTFPHVVMELSQQEIKAYFTPRDFRIGDTVTIYNRRFLIYDVDDFTKAFYWKNFGVTDFDPVNVDQPANPNAKMEVAPYNGFGSLEDSMQSCMSLVPQPPKKDYIKMLDNDHKNLRFEALMDTPHPEDHGRRFIVSYHLSDDTMTIYEPPVRNSGIIGGKFLEHTRVAKPGSTPNTPQFYGPADCFVGATIEVFGHRFVITNADEFVLTYMKEHPTQFPEHTVQSVQDKLQDNPPPGVPLKGGPTHITRETGLTDREALVNEVEGQLKKLAITASNRKDHVFLSINTNRQGFISKENLRALVSHHHLPADPDIIEGLAARIGADPDHITLDEMRTFFESEKHSAATYNPIVTRPMPPSLATGRIPAP
ncbi:EF-hand domain-containing protein 1 [Lamellibrachia satsuma]|nr:EF-hand domain-containing protein 1 [Lamellibrachia satsuma]